MTKKAKPSQPQREEGEAPDDYQTRCQIYDRLLIAIPDPAVVRFGTRCLIGAWVSVGHATASTSVGDCGFVMRTATRAVRVFGEAQTWSEAEAKAWTWLETLWAKSGHTDPRRHHPGPLTPGTSKGKPPGMPPV